MRIIGRIRLERLKRGYSLDEVWLRTNRRLSPTKLSRIERGFVEPSGRDLLEIEDALDMPPGTLSKASTAASEGVAGD